MATEQEALALDDEYHVREAHRTASRWESGIIRAAFRPPVRMSGSEWANSYRFLSPESSAVPGKFDVERAPYQKEPLDAMCNPRGGDVVLMWPSQVGKTEVVNNAIGQRIHLRPGPMLVVQPTLDMAKTWSKDRCAPMIRDTPVLRRLVRDPKSRDSESTMLHKSFVGGHLTVTGANAPSGLASRPIRDTFCDEVDRYPDSAGAEGDPVLLAEQRTATFGNALHARISTPTIKGRSRIERAFKHSDQRHYYVPCPHCGEMQILYWGGTDVAHGLKWESGRPETAYYVCVKGCEIEEMYKPQMLARGEWRAHNPGHPTRGYWINALYSPFEGARWGKLAAKFLMVKDNPLQLRPFINTVLCEAWEDTGEQVDAHELTSRLEPYPCDCKPGTHEPLTCTTRKVPAGVAVLTRSVDTQGDRLEVAIWGFGPHIERWLIDKEVIPGDPGTPAPWRALAASLDREWPHETGVKLKAEVTFIDSGGHHTKEVYNFTREHRADRVFAIKGMQFEGAPLLGRATRNNDARAILYPIGVFAGKESFLSALGKIRAPGAAYVHLPDWVDMEDLQQLTAEKLVTRIVGGRPKRTWIKTRDRNEGLDLAVYAEAALWQLGHVFVNRLEDTLKEHAAAGAKLRGEQPQAGDGDDDAPPQDPPRRPPRRGGWMDGYR